LLLVIGAGGAYWLNVRHYESTDDAFIDAHVTHVAPRVPGRVRQVLVDDNQWVEAGTLLVEIDPADYQVKLDQAQAAKTEAESRLQEAHARQTVAATSLQQAQAEAAAAEANATNAATDFTRIQRLRAQSVASQQEFDNAKTAATDTAARLAAARQQVLTDGHALDEYRAEFGRTLVCGFGRLGGIALGVVATQRLRFRPEGGGPFSLPDTLPGVC
jgi:membrane fusion protein (multidrug efflux system)